jgi:hypothetical protein
MFHSNPLTTGDSAVTMLPGTQPRLSTSPFAAASPALPPKLSARIVGLDRSEVLHCDGADFDAEGIRFDAPASCGLAVGQRYEVVFGGDPESDQVASFVGDSHYATILRTEKSATGPSQLGVRMQFDNPLLV